MVYEIPHKCNVFDFCIVSEGVEILFCIFCRKVAGLKEGDNIKLKSTIFTDKKRNEYSDELKQALV
jgi:hypothetical protein